MLTVTNKDLIGWVDVYSSMYINYIYLAFSDVFRYTSKVSTSFVSLNINPCSWYAALLCFVLCISWHECNYCVNSYKWSTILMLYPIYFQAITYGVASLSDTVVAKMQTGVRAQMMIVYSTYHNILCMISHFHALLHTRQYKHADRG